MSKYFKDYSELRREALKDPEVKREYDLLGPEYEAIGKIIELRIKSKMTQKQMAKKLGTKQSAISPWTSLKYSTNELGGDYLGEETVN